MKIRPIFKTIDIFSFIQFLSRQTNYIIKFFLLKVLYLVFHPVNSYPGRVNMFWSTMASPPVM